jgi:hypothetical protein
MRAVLGRRLTCPVIYLTRDVSDGAAADTRPHDVPIRPLAAA